MSTRPASSPPQRPRRAAWPRLGAWFLMLALLALQVHGLRHYQADMLALGVCSATPALAATATGNEGLVAAGERCAQCCLLHEASPLPVRAPSLAIRSATPRPAMVARSADPARLTPWPRSRPRGPPAQA
ncbi:hypothetical protein RQP53_17430 [Paucibacter sp. APW11]|uniref:DUF2946 domain-containing protein n=1 Tax=Roseateles aquae TaxID=3077235 RepID=A0ABU3PEU6_9BURK|nr:hypothetical protein [Paucibacter sp. APW11]MDT9001064.1 hypothetical protein [Paucibacter sp. APW11]